MMERAKNIRMTDTDKLQSVAISKQFCKPGDLILVKTPSSFYNTMRKLFQSDYDHTVLVVDEERCLHISYPTAKLVPTYLFTHIIREPLVIRLNVFSSSKIEDQTKRELFLLNIKHSSIGKKYDSARVFAFLR